MLYNWRCTRLRVRELRNMNSRTKKSLGIIATLLVIVIGVMTWHQRTHFNKNTTINGVAVGGLTAQQAYDKVAKTKLTNEVKLDGKVIFDHGEVVFD